MLKLANKKLSTNQHQWNSEIIDCLISSYPFLNVPKIDAEIKKMDEDRGYAIGSVVIPQTKTARRVNIPFVIKGGELLPMDVLMFLDKSERILPITKKNFELAASNEGLFSDSRYDRRGINFVSLYDELAPPRTGKTVYASNNMSAAGLMKNLTKKEAIKIAKVLNKYNVFDDYVNALSTTEFPEKNAADDIRTFLADGCVLIKKAGDKFAKLSIDRNNFPISSMIGGFDSLLSTLNHYMPNRSAENSKIANDLKNNKRESVLFDTDLEKDGAFGNGYWKSTATPYVNETWNPQSISKFGRYKIRTQDGRAIVGFIIPKVVDFNMKDTGNKMWVGRENWAIDGDIQGGPVKNNRPGTTRLMDNTLTAGNTYTLIFENNDQPVCTEPIQVDNTFNVDNQYGGEGITASGKTVVFKMEPNVKTIVKIHPGNDDVLKRYGSEMYLIPETTKSVYLGGKVNLMGKGKSDAVMGKEAYDSVAYDAQMKSYHIKGPNYSPMRKLATINPNYHSGALSRDEACFRLYGSGFSLPQAAEIIREAEKVASEGKYAYFQAPVTSKDTYEFLKNISLLKMAGDKMSSEVLKNFDIEAFSKLAEGMNDETVDKVLSLQFINKSNITHFIKAIDSFKEVEQSLGQLLLAARVGMENVDEESVSRALTSLDDVIQSLENSKNLSAKL